MAQVPFSSIQAFSETCMTAGQPEQIAAPLSQIVGGLGYSSWYAGSLLHEGELQRGFGYYCGSPSWSKRYTEQNYCLVDPIFAAACGDERPIRWRDFTRHGKLSEKSRRVLDEAGEFGIRDGFTKAWHTFGEIPGAISFGGENPDFSNEARMSLLLLGAFAYEGFRRVAQGFKPVPPLLTRRERDVLQWAAEGKTAWEIGAILSIGERTVRCYLDQLKRKYKVPTAIQVIVLAMLDGNLKVQVSTRRN